MHPAAQAIADNIALLNVPGSPFELGKATYDGVEYNVFTQAPKSVKELLDVARGHGDGVFLAYEAERLTFKQYFEQVDALSYQLVKALGIGKGDRVAVAMRNFPEWMVAWTAIVSVGAVVVPLNSWGSADELQYGLNDCDAQVVICDEQRYELTKDLPKQFVVVRSEATLLDNAQHWSSFIAPGFAPERSQPLPESESAGEDPIMILYTSGTTGRPKGAVSSHRNICQTIYNFEMMAAASAMANPKIIEAMFADGYAPNSLLIVPLFHVSGLYAQFLLALRGGRKLTIMYKWDATKALQLIEQERITIFAGTPTQVIDLFEHPDFAKTDTSSLFSIGAGGSASPDRLKRLVEDGLETPYSGAGYGSTETNAAGSSCTGAAHDYKPKSAGTLSPIVEVETRDEDGKPLAKGETGELYLKSPTNVSHYWQRPEDNAKTFVDGWLASGDIGRVDEENFLFLSDRAKDLIIRGGENIYPGEIENVLMDHPNVHEAAVLGLADDRYGEIPVAVVRADECTNEAELIEHAQKRLAGFKVPSAITITGDALLRNATGKLLKRKLLELYFAKTSP